MVKRMRSELIEKPIPKWLSLLLVLLGIPFCVRFFIVFGDRDTLFQDIMMTTFAQLYLADLIWQRKVRIKLLLPIPFLFCEEVEEK